MLKHIKPIDLVEFLLFGLGFVALILLAGFLESAPLGQTIWLAIALAFVLWIVWGVLRASERRNAATARTMWMMVDGQWVALDGSGRKLPGKRRAVPIFDQDADAINHLDPDNTKEQKA